MNFLAVAAKFAVATLATYLERMSAQPHRTSPYSEELRWRVIYQFYGLSLGYRQIASNLNIDTSTVCRVIQRFEETGDVKKKTYPQGHNHHLKKLTKYDETFILELVAEKPGMYLKELQTEVHELTGTDISITTICNFMHRSGLTHRKLNRVAGQRNDILRSQFMFDTSIFPAEMLVFLDESGTDRRDTLRKYGYSLRGQPARALSMLPRGVHLSAIAAMCSEGVLACKIVEGGVNGQTFDTFLSMDLSSKLNPFDGINARSVVVMDNASIHHVDQVVKFLEDLGVLVCFLPPYSPDMNPIEELFSKVKYVMKANEFDLEGQDLETCILSGFASVTADDCKKWIQHSGYLFLIDELPCIPFFNDLTTMTSHSLQGNLCSI